MADTIGQLCANLHLTCTPFYVDVTHSSGSAYTAKQGLVEFLLYIMVKNGNYNKFC